MTRNRKTAKDAGARFERSMADFLSFRLRDEAITRRARNGAKDRGDLNGLRSIFGDRIVAELKDHGGQLLVGPWLGEAQREAGNDDAEIAIVIAKRRGTADPASQYVFMTVEDLIRLLGGGNYGRP